jgi:hypothetical protein
MATKTAAQMASDVLENLGATAAGQSASAEDTDKALVAIAAVYALHKRDGLAPYEPTAYPEWAQLAVCDVVSFRLRNVFGLGGERRAAIEQAYPLAVVELQRQTAGRHDPRVTTRARYF